MQATPFDRPRLVTAEPAEERRNPLVLLEICRGMARRRLRPVSGPVFVIGASAECDLVLADPQFPEMHAYLLVREEGVSLRHLGVRPEITVNGRAVEAVELLDGDRLRTGPYEFRVHVLTAPDGPGDNDAADVRRHAKHAPIQPIPTPLSLVRALAAQVRAKTSRPAPAKAAVSPLPNRDAA